MIIYKKDSKNKIRILDISVDGFTLISKSGLIDGALVTNKTICKSKNIGKANETTAEEQAIKEMEALIEIKIKDGYFRTQKEAEDSDLFFPMLAYPYEKYKDTFKAGDHIMVQPKLDGFRCNILLKDSKIILKSREGRIFELPHISEVLTPFFDKNPNIILDGELYEHGLSFQEVSKKIKNGEKIAYHVYDFYDLDYPERIGRDVATLFTGLSVSEDFINYIYVINSITISVEKIHAWFLNFIQLEYEGMIIRRLNTPYKVNGRSKDLLKYKVFKDIQLHVLDVVPSPKKTEWGQFVFELDGKLFSAGMKFNHEFRKEVLLNKQNYIGLLAEIRYFELSDDGIPRFPVVYGFRDLEFD